MANPFCSFKLRSFTVLAFPWDVRTASAALRRTPPHLRAFPGSNIFVFEDATDNHSEPAYLVTKNHPMENLHPQKLTAGTQTIGGLTRHVSFSKRLFAGSILVFGGLQTISMVFSNKPLPQWNPSIRPFIGTHNLIYNWWWGPSLWNLKPCRPPLKVKKDLDPKYPLRSSHCDSVIDLR